MPTTEVQSDLELQIHRAIIQPKILQKKKLPRIIPTKQNAKLHKPMTENNEKKLKIAPHTTAYSAYSSLALPILLEVIRTLLDKA